MKSSQQKGYDLERQVAKDINGRVTPGSGNLWFAKADVDSDHFKIQCKYTDRDSFSIPKQAIQELYRQAAEAGKLPALVLAFGTFKIVVLDYGFLLEAQENLLENEMALHTRQPGELPVKAAQLFIGFPVPGLHPSQRLTTGIYTNDHDIICEVSGPQVGVTNVWFTAIQFAGLVHHFAGMPDGERNQWLNYFQNRGVQLKQGVVNQ